MFLDGQLASTAMLFYGMEFCGRLLCPYGGTGSGMDVCAVGCLLVTSARGRLPRSQFLMA